MHPFVGVIQNEVRIQSRRRGLKVMVISHALTMVAFLVVFSGIQQSSEVGQFAASGQEQWQDATRIVLFGTWTATSALAAFLLPIVLADSIPYDKQVGIIELLHSTPLTYSHYLLGKAIGASLALAGALVIILLAIAIPWWVVGFPFNPITYAAMIFLAVPPIVFANTMLVVLAAAEQPNVFRGLLVGVGILFVIPIAVGLQHSGLIPFLLPSRQPMLNLYGFQGGYFSLFSRELSHVGAYLINVIAALIEIVALFGIMLGWRRFKEDHR